MIFTYIGRSDGYGTEEVYLSFYHISYYVEIEFSGSYDFDYDYFSWYQGMIINLTYFYITRDCRMDYVIFP